MEKKEKKKRRRRREVFVWMDARTGGTFRPHVTKNQSLIRYGDTLDLLLSTPYSLFCLSIPSKMPWQRQSLLSIRRLQPLQPFTSLPTRFHPRSPRSVRGYATDAQDTFDISAAPEIDFAEFHTQPARVVPASPSYFSGRPKFTDSLLELEALLGKYETLPIVPMAQAPQMAWLKINQFRESLGEPIAAKRFRSIIKILQRLNQIDPALAPQEVRSKLHIFLRPGNPFGDKPAPAVVDELGRARGKGKRKTSSAVVQLVEGEGEFLVNGKNLQELFHRLHDRESATWPLRCVQRLDKYNVWATVKGGGVTGQAEAITLALARALLVHEPALKPILRKGESIAATDGGPANIFQPVSLPSIPDRWRGRSPVAAKLANRHNGSRGERGQSVQYGMYVCGRVLQLVWYRVVYPYYSRQTKCNIATRKEIKKATNSCFAFQ